MKQILFEIILEEGRREMLVYAEKHKIPSYIVDQILKADPTSTKKYSMTILRWIKYDVEHNRRYGWGGNAVESVSNFILNYIQASDVFKEFEERKGTRNIQDFKSMAEMLNFLAEEPFPDLSKKQTKKLIKNPENLEKIVDTDKCLVLRIKKFKASCFAFIFSLTIVRSSFALRSTFCQYHFSSRRFFSASSPEALLLLEPPRSSADAYSANITLKSRPL
jgi:hypothetical protein